MITMEWQMYIQTHFRRFLLLLGQCDLCGNPLNENLPAQQALLCSACFADLPLFNYGLIQRDLLNWPAINKALVHSHYDHLICLSPYLPPFTHWLPQLKYQARFELATFFATVLAQQWRKQTLVELMNPIDLVLSVPLHINKWKIRGYNQAHLLAKPLAKQLQIPYDASALIRTQNNKSQVGKTGKQRRQSLANIFTLAKVFSNKIKHVMLVDDVITTGSTVNEISKILKCFGVKEVTIVTACLTLPQGKNYSL